MKGIREKLTDLINVYLTVSHLDLMEYSACTRLKFVNASESKEPKISLNVNELICLKDSSQTLNESSRIKSRYYNDNILSL